MTITSPNNMSQTAAGMLPITVLTNSSENSSQNELTAENEGIEELGALFLDHYKGMFRIGYRITGSQSDAEDVLQTVFVRLTPDWSSRDLSPNPRAFLYRAAINASLDVVRRRKR